MAQTTSMLRIQEKRDISPEPMVADNYSIEILLAKPKKR